MIFFFMSLEHSEPIFATEPCGFHLRLLTVSKKKKKIVFSLSKREFMLYLDTLRILCKAVSMLVG